MKLDGDNLPEKIVDLLYFKFVCLPLEVNELTKNKVLKSLCFFWFFVWFFPAMLIVLAPLALASLAMAFCTVGL